MGCDEVIDADLTGPLSVSISPPPTNTIASGPPPVIIRLVILSGSVVGRASRLDWSFGDGAVETNANCSSYHFYTNAGVFPLTLTAYNLDKSNGVSATSSICILPLLGPSVQIPVIVGNQLQVTFPTQSNVVYTVQYATNLTPPALWVSLNKTWGWGMGTPLTFTDTLSNSARYYRILAQ